MLLRGSTTASSPSQRKAPTGTRWRLSGAATVLLLRRVSHRLEEVEGTPRLHR